MWGETANGERKRFYVIKNYQKLEVALLPLRDNRPHSVAPRAEDPLAVRLANHVAGTLALRAGFAGRKAHRLWEILRMFEGKGQESGKYCGQADTQKPFNGSDSARPTGLSLFHTLNLCTDSAKVSTIIGDMIPQIVTQIFKILPGGVKFWHFKCDVPYIVVLLTYSTIDAG